jgi:hypothetical protein
MSWCFSEGYEYVHSFCDRYGTIAMFLSATFQICSQRMEVLIPDL